MAKLELNLLVCKAARLCMWYVGSCINVLNKKVFFIGCSFLLLFIILYPQNMRGHGPPAPNHSWRPWDTTPHCWGHHVQKVDTEAKFYVILFVMINALIWCNFEKNRLGSFWDNPIYPIRYPHGQDLGFFWKVKRCSFIVIQLFYTVLWLFSHNKCTVGI